MWHDTFENTVISRPGYLVHSCAMVYWYSSFPNLSVKPSIPLDSLLPGKPGEGGLEWDFLEVHLFFLWFSSLSSANSWWILLSGTMVARRPTDQIDSAPFVVGMITVLKQFHSEYTEQFLACCGQYVRSLIEATANKLVRNTSHKQRNKGKYPRPIFPNCTGIPDKFPHHISFLHGAISY